MKIGLKQFKKKVSFISKNNIKILFLKDLFWKNVLFAMIMMVCYHILIVVYNPFIGIICS